jgi:fatty acid desaturase
MDKLLRIPGALLIGYLCCLLCNYIFQSAIYGALVPIGQVSGIVFMVTHLWLYVTIAIALLIQVFIVVPKTMHSTKKAIRIATILCLFVALVFVGVNIAFERTTQQSLLAFAATFIGFESFWMGNLLFLTVLNNRKNKSTI